VETAQEVAAYEPDEGEKVTPTVIKKALKALIIDLKDSIGESARKELQALKNQDAAIKAVEKRIKDAKTTLKRRTNELEIKLQLKRLGGDEFRAENQDLIRQVDAQLSGLNPDDKADKKKINALNKDKTALGKRVARIDALLSEIGGRLTEDKGKRLILKKLYDIANAELERYLNAEKRLLLQGVENLWDKYAVSSRELETTRAETLAALDGFMIGLGYLGTKT